MLFVFIFCHIFSTIADLQKYIFFVCILIFSDLERLKTQFLQTYGFERLLTFNKLFRMGLLSTRDTLARRTIQASAQQLQGNSSAQKTSGMPFQQVIKKLGLSTKNPNQQSADQESLLIDQSR